MAVNLSPVGNGFQFFSNDGLPLAGGKILTYQAGSTTPFPTYTTVNGTIANTNPIILGTSGRPPNDIWLEEGYFYKFVLTDSSDVVIQTYDNLYGIIGVAPTPATPTPAGVIVLWSGSIGSIPAGWVLCNGNNGTPDLRDRFIVGAGSTYAVDASGGSLTTGNPSVTDTGPTSLTVANLPAHDHFVSNTETVYTNTALTNSNYIKRGGGASGALEVYTLSGSATAPTVGLTSQTGSGTGHTHTLAHTHTSTPPYYALCYIMKT